MILTAPIDPDETSLADLLGRYREAVVEAASDIDPSTLAGESGLDEASIEASTSEPIEGISIEVAAVILGKAEGMPPDTARATVRDHLLLAMSGAVMDVEALARAVETDVEPGEVQAKVEGRLPMTLEEYARLLHAIARQGP